MYIYNKYFMCNNEDKVIFFYFRIVVLEIVMGRVNSFI